MENPKNSLWMEKYRPKTLDEMVLTPDVKELLDKIVAQNDPPNLLLLGSVGSGKTTIAKILLNTLDCESLTMNASNERGIEIIRGKVQKFAMTMSYKKWKIVFMDEFDAVTPEAQMAMRNTMETYSENTRFILTGNYGNRISEPIRSRCQVVEFKNIPRKNIRQNLERILKAENVKYNIDELICLVDLYYPDIRSMTNHLQMNTNNGEWLLKNTEDFRNYEALLNFIQIGNYVRISEMNISYVDAYSYLFNMIGKDTVLTSDTGKRVEILQEIADALKEDTWAPVKSVVFRNCMLQIMHKLDISIRF